MYSLSLRPAALPLTVNIPHHSGTYGTVVEPTLTHHYHPEVIVYIMGSLLILHVLWVWANV